MSPGHNIFGLVIKDSQNMGDKVEDEKMSQGRECQQQARQQSINASPPSASSSPSHEFSFTISLHQPPTLLPEKAKSPPSFAVDLSPADDIFFHGHLLPLGLLSQPHPLFPRSSTSSLPEAQKPSKTTDLNVAETKEKPKAKSFSLFGLSSRRNGFEVGEIKEENSRKKQKLRKLRFNMSHVLKGYIRLFRPLWSFRVKKVNIQLRRKTYSFSGGLSPREKEDQLRGRRSAPASMRTSPGNSRTLVLAAVGAGPAPSASSASTMEELQAAIQAAIAHCKNSMAMAEENIQRS